jgi:RNA polymerase subunit RPABC4/transcription elongation factor Spt4
MALRAPKSGPKSPKFFCENCNAEVPRDAKNCPKCGRYFASVRCPACDFIGEEAFFKEGCPVCGYSASPAAQNIPEPKRKTLAGALPLWVFILTSAALMGILAAIFLRFFR